MQYHFFQQSFLRGSFFSLLAVLLTACGGGGGSGSSAQVTVADLANIQAYVADSPYSDQLEPCVLSAQEGDYCLLSDLPLLVTEASQPGVEDIMGRVLVSHAWMGLRFQQVLATMPSQVLQLFSAITTIVIDDNVRPSYFTPASSTIFIDPAYLWLKNWEKNTISREQDYRSDFSNELQFVSLARYVDEFDYAWLYYPLDGDEERSLEDIKFALAQLLLHELAHANDYFPADETPYLDLNQTAEQAYRQLQDQAISQALRETAPLTSSTLYDLAAVMYLGATASYSQTQITALEVGEAFELDIASDDYAYASRNEDVAMLFEEAMMKYLFALDRDIAYTNRPAAGSDCDAYLVAWGVRGRIGDSEVKARAQQVVEAIYPGQDFSLFFQDLAAPISMRAEEGWCENLALF